MSRSNVLHPRKVDNVIDVTEFVNVFRLDTNVQFEGRDWREVGLHQRIVPRSIYAYSFFDKALLNKGMDGNLA